MRRLRRRGMESTLRPRSAEMFIIKRLPTPLFCSERLTKQRGEPCGIRRIHPETRAAEEQHRFPAGDLPGCRALNAFPQSTGQLAFGIMKTHRDA